MTYANSSRFLLTTLNPTVPCDVIFCGDDVNKSFITNALRSDGIGFTYMTDEDAAKILHENGGVGIGCYLRGANERLNEYRRTIAEVNYRDLSRRFGFIRFVQPIELLSIEANPRATVTKARG